MSTDMRFLLVHVLGGAASALALTGVCALLGLRLPLPLMLAAGMAAGAGLWLMRLEAVRADQVDAPPLDLDVDYALPHGRDMRVRRLEDLVHGAQPHRRMTARPLARILGEIADEREHAPAAPPLSPSLHDLVEQARQPATETDTIRAIDRRTLHRYLRELANPEE